MAGTDTAHRRRQAPVKSWLHSGERSAEVAGRPVLPLSGMCRMGLAELFKLIARAETSSLAGVAEPGEAAAEAAGAEGRAEGGRRRILTTDSTG